MVNGANLERLQGGDVCNISYSYGSQYNGILGLTEKQVSGATPKFASFDLAWLLNYYHYTQSTW